MAAMMRYYIQGAYYPEGGSHRIAEAIIPTIEKAGGRVLCRAKVGVVAARLREALFRTFAAISVGQSRLLCFACCVGEAVQSRITLTRQLALFSLFPCID